MTGQMNVKVRLVRCPRCSRLLPEMADVPVYKCGGCGTVLKAKNRKNDAKDIEPRVNKSDPTQESDPEHVSEDQGTGSLNQQTTVPSSIESVVGKSSKESDPEHVSEDRGTGSLNQQTTFPSSIESVVDKSSKESDPEHVSDELCGSTELTLHENAGLSTVANRSGMEANEDNHLDQHGNKEDFGEKKFPGEASPSTEPSCQENESSSPFAGAHIEVNESRSLEQNDEGNQSEFGEDDKEVDENLRGRSNIEVNGSKSLEENGKGDQSEFGEDDIEVDENLRGGSNIEVNGSKSLEENDKGDQSEFREDDTEVDENLRGGSNIEVNGSKSLKENDKGGQSEFGEDDTEVDENLRGRSNIEVNGSKSLEENDKGDQSEFGEDDTEVDENLKIFSNIKVNGSKSLEENGKCDQIEFGEDDTEVDDNLKSHSNIEVNGSKSLEENGKGDQIEFGEDTEVDENLKSCSHKEVNQSKSFEHNDENNQSESGEDAEVDENLKSRSISKSSSGENLSDSSQMYSFATPQRSFAGSIFSDNLGSPPKEQMKQGQNGIIRALERVSSTDTLENVPRVSLNSKLGVTLGDISKSPTTNSYHAYYGSESSCNENEYGVHGRFPVPKRNFKGKGLISPKGLPQRDEVMMKHKSTKGNKWHQDEFSEPTRRVPRVPLYSRGTQAGPSTFGHNNFQYNSMYHSSNEHECPESSRVELLKMVCELQDQLDRKYSSTEATNGRYRYSHGKNWSQPCQINRMAFSGEAGHFRHQTDCLCLRCVPQERHFSAQLPRHYMAQPSPNYYSSHRSGSSSPIQYTGSDFSSWSRDNDQWHKDRELKKLNLRENHQPIKRHFRPVAGGSPVIACYLCSALLQLPADFLVFKRRFHLLRCSECSKILKFSLRNRIQLVRYLPDAIAPPPSEVEYADPINKRSLASASQASELISCSVDYGRSSTEGERFSSLVPPFHTRGSGSGDRKMSSVGSSEPVEERNKSVLNELKNKNKNRSSESKKTGSPLHRLMGYASPSKVWRGDFNGH